MSLIDVAIDRLAEARRRKEEVGRELADPDLIKDRDRYQGVAREFSLLEQKTRLLDEIERVKAQLAEVEDLIDDGDPEMAELAQVERDELTRQLDQLGRQAVDLVAPRDPNDEKNVLLEIRAGTGGEEAALFAGELFRMYARYAERRGWKVELLSESLSDKGGYKEVVASITGQEVFGRLKYERGVHRVQRVPVTESQGRIHTSAVTVAVLPEAEEVEIEINNDELRIDRFRSSGPGGQSVNTTDSAIRITHLPTGLVVSCQDEKSQHKNLAKAMKILRSRLYDLALREQEEKLARERRSQVGTGDRSAKIRTFNFPQGRVTDHRIKLTTHRLEAVLQGDLDELIDALRLADQQALLASA